MEIDLAYAYKEIFLWVKENKRYDVYQFVNICIGKDDISGIWGYALEFFDSVGIEMGVFKDEWTEDENKCWFYWAHDELTNKGFCKTRPEAQREALKKAHAIYENGKS